MRKKAIFISDFTIDNFVNILLADKSLSEFEIVEPPLSGAINSLIDIDNSCWQDVNLCAIWLTPNCILPELNNISNQLKISDKYIYQSIDNFTKLIINLSKKVEMFFIPSFSYNTINRDINFLSMSDNNLSNIIIKMNIRLIENLKKYENLFILNTDRWLKTIGKKSFNARSWYKAKIPFSNELFVEASKDILSAIHASKGLTKKLLILDLDNTLWGGVIGEDGIENIDLGGHSAIGESFVDFQKNILNLKSRGILLAIVSKNNEIDALHAIENHPEMILKKKDFVSWRINWENKENNIIEIVEELNLGLDSVVFIDDSEIERNRILNFLPHVLVPEFPASPFDLSNFLNELSCFDKISITEEDINRHQMYTDEEKRKVNKLASNNVKDWFSKLEIKIEANKLDRNNLKRCVQLLNKTNQMNLSTRRMTETEFLTWSANDNIHVFTINVSDKFGYYGLVGILSVKKNNNILDIIDYVVSCRALGRKVEDSILFLACQYGELLKCNKIKLKYIKTKKNSACYRFLKESSIIHEETKNIFSINTSDCFKPKDISINRI